MLQQPTVTFPFVIIVADCSAAGPMVTIDEDDVSGGSHEATVGQSLTLSCNTAPADWKKGSDTVTKCAGVCNECTQPHDGRRLWGWRRGRGQ